MNTRKSGLMAAGAGIVSLLIAGCASQPSDGDAGNGWNVNDLSAALANPARPQADRDRDADRKPAQLVTFFGVKPGMTVVDVIAAGGYFTEVLATAVGPTGKVYAQNPPMLLKFREGAYDKAITERLANNRLENVIRVDADLPPAVIAPGSIDVAVTALNFHDVHNMNPAAGQAFMKSVYTMLKPGGVFGVIDHVGKEGADNAKLHRVPEQVAIDAAKAAGFTVEAQSELLAHPDDDHTRVVFDPGLRGKTDQFVLRLRKSK